VWESRDVHTRRAARSLLAGAAAVLAVAGLAGCRTDPGVAAYVGDGKITVAALESAVDARLADPAIAAYAQADRDSFTRRVLSLLVLERVYDAAAQQYHVAATDDEALQYLGQVVGASGVDQEFQQDAQQGFTRDDVLELLREQLLRLRIAGATGASDALSEESLRAQYQKDLAQYQQYTLGYVTVPDQPTADAVLAQLQAQPAAYPQIAAAFPGSNTLPQLTPYPTAKIPAFGDQVAATPPGTGFTSPVQGVGVVVTFVAAVTTAPFEQVRDQVEASVRDGVDTAGQQVVDGFRDFIGVTVNPRYGVVKDQLVVQDTGGVVDILDEDRQPASPSAGG
jgi:parvulin-like peptidyl-prolyl isomerase